MSALDAARRYLRRGWLSIPVPYQSKNPGFSRWEQLRLHAKDLERHFNCKPQNIGVLLGEPSGWLVDVDLDHPRAVALADDYLPHTPLIFGRPGKPRSHRLYRVASPIATKKHKSKSAGMIVEVRSTGTQTVFPPSIHESGESIEWEDEDAEAAVVEPGELLAKVQQLADRVKVEIGDKSRSSSSKKRVAKPSDSGADGFSQVNRRELCLASMLRMTVADTRDGSGRLFAVACRTVEHDLSPQQALDLIKEYADRRPFPHNWSDSEILTRVRDAEQRCERGKAVSFTYDADGLVKLGTRDLTNGKLVLSTSRTLPTATAFIDEFHRHLSSLTLYSHGGTPFVWRGNRYREIEADALRHQIQSWLHDALQYKFQHATGEMKLVPFPANPGTVEATLKTVYAHVHLPVTTTSPSWLAGGSVRPEPLELLPFPSGTLHIPSGEVLEPTPELFNTNALDFDYDPEAPAPVRWLAFLSQLWEDDVESVRLLQEWMGYSLISDTSLQKMLLLVGPKRAGKGTIGRVLTQLVGKGNVTGPTVSSLGGNFGLQPLLGKTLAIVSDARFTGEHIGVVVERLLCISGEDTLTVDRKFLGSVTTKLPTRFVFLTNELPRMNDASGALASRFLLLRFTKSFYDQEDAKLYQTLATELPGILLWAVQGLRRLRQRGHFVQPSAAADAMLDLEDLASPVLAFVRACCCVGAGNRVAVNALYGRWKSWCESEGRTCITNKQTFGRDLAAAVPGVVRRRGTANNPFYDGLQLLEES